MFPALSLDQTIDTTIREERGRILASLVAGLNDFQLAEDCLQDAVLSALDHWRKNGLPRAPAAWLITVARRKALDKLRRAQNFAAKQDEISYLLALENRAMDETMTDTIPDHRLEMMFTCCHPALDQNAQVALSLRTLGGLSTPEIATAFLVSSDAMQRRISRAKKKISTARIPYAVPDKTDLPNRTASVLSVIYLIFNEGYSASNGHSLTRLDLSNEAIRLARILAQLLPDDTEVAGLLALMLLHDSRRIARSDASGALIPLEAHNRKRWNQSKILEGVEILKNALPKQRIGPYQLQAAISAVHAQSPSWGQTDWHEISCLYALLFALQPSPVVRINHAIAVSYAQSPQQGLDMLANLAGADKLHLYQPYHAALGDLLARAGHADQARQSLLKAAELSDNAKEQAFLRAKADSL